MANWTYEDLRFYEQMLKKLKETPGSTTEHIEKRIIEQKRQLRKASKRTSNTQVIRDGFDSYVEKFPLPKSIKTEEDAREYFMEYEYIHFRPSAYDCTGQWFTSWYKIFRKPDGRFWAYHSIGMDI